MGQALRVRIVTTGDTPDWEAAILSGALRSRGIEVVKANPGDASATAPRDLVVCLPSSAEDLARLCGRARTSRPVVIAGRRLSANPSDYASIAGSGAIACIGEPYQFVTDLARDPTRLHGLSGMTQVGSLLADLRGVSLGLGNSDRSRRVPVLTSLGCEKACGYCPYGTVHRKIYGSAFTRRERQWSEIRRDCHAAIRSGADALQLVADQVVSDQPQNNRQLQQFAADAFGTRTTRIRLHFAISPRAVINNQYLMHSLAAKFLFEPTLSIDSLDDDALKMFAVGFGSDDALNAALVLASAGIRFRINYIFTHPWKTDQGLLRELERLAALSEIVAHFPPQWQFLLVRDILSTKLVLLPGAPLTKRFSSSPPPRGPSTAHLASAQAAVETLERETRRSNWSGALLRRVVLASSRRARSEIGRR